MVEMTSRENLQKEGQDFAKPKRCLPKNIRQVGSPRGRHKIYIEDYVYTYIQNMAKKKDPCAAIFLGMAQVIQDIRYTFISGAVECGAAIFQWDNIQLDDSFWDYIYKEKKQYFPDLEIVGWFLGRGGQPMELPPSVESAHRKYFTGRDKILMLMDILEGEEIFFIHEQGYLQKREGYYIYYEKNLPMQEYMVSKHEEEQRLDKLADGEGLGYGAENTGRHSKDAEFASLWKEMESEGSGAMPRTDEFAGLYKELEQMGSSLPPKKPQEMPSQKLFQEILSIQSRGSGKGEAAGSSRDLEREKGSLTQNGTFASEPQNLESVKGVQPGKKRPASDAWESGKEKGVQPGKKRLVSGTWESGKGQGVQPGKERPASDAWESGKGQGVQPGKERPASDTWESGKEQGVQPRRNDPSSVSWDLEREEGRQLRREGRRDHENDQAKGLREKSKAQKARMENVGKSAAKIFVKNNGKDSKTPAEEALESYRNVALERHGRQMAQQNRNFLYTASAFFLVILCVMGITTINNYRKMQEVEETLHILKADSGNGTEGQGDSQASKEGQGDSLGGAEGKGDSPNSAGQEASQNGAEGQEGLVVESIGSQVAPLEEQGQAGSQNAADPGQQETPQDAAETSASGQERIRYYTVQPGDTLDSICVSIYNSLDIREELCQLNKIEDGNKIFVGQKLQLP